MTVARRMEYTNEGWRYVTMSTRDLSVWDGDVTGSLVMVAVGIVSPESY